MRVTYARSLLVIWTAMFLVACERTSTTRAPAALPEEPSLLFRNVEMPTAYVGDDACTNCHESAASAYQAHAMAKSFHEWTPESRIEAPLDEPIAHPPSGFVYSVVEVGGELFQEEFIIGPGGSRLHELRRRIDYVMGSGTIARTYFTAENGRLFQLPLTWYRQKGWDFSPGYELNNPRFDRLMPDRCIACHGSYPQPLPFLEGKYAMLPPGIGCERCHGPGALHVTERSADTTVDSTYDSSIVNPKHLPFERRLDVCEQCHVHTPVSVLREGEDAFGYMPSQRLADHIAFFKPAGSIDVVSHADRLRQSACFVGSRSSNRPLDCATCHDPHGPLTDQATQNVTCQSCHPVDALAGRMDGPAARADHHRSADCVTCHMPQVKERTIPHGSFTDHWIRIVADTPEPEITRRTTDRPVEPYFERDRRGALGAIYQAMGEVVYATLADNSLLLDEAAEALDRALAADTTLRDPHFLLGLAYRQLGRNDDAIRVLERAVRLNPGHPDRVHALARAYEASNRNTDTIASLYQQALELQPALAWVRADYAHFLHALGRRTEAEDAYRAALREQPSLHVAAFNLGTLLTGMGRHREASEAFESAVRLNPSLAEALAPLFLIRASGTAIVGIREAGSPLARLPVRYRGPNAVQVSVSTTATVPALAISNVPPGAQVRILEPDGTVVRALRAAEAPRVTWDLRSATGNPIPGGLYHVHVQGQDSSGRPLPPQRFAVGVVSVGGR